MVKDDVKVVTISIRKEQFDWMNEYRKEHMFVLSKFVKVKLDDFRKFVEEVENAKRIGRE